MAWVTFCSSQRRRCGTQGCRDALASPSLGCTKMTLTPGPRSADFQSRSLAVRILPMRTAWGYQLPDSGHLPWSLWPSLGFWSQISYSTPQCHRICCYPHGQMRTPGSGEAVRWREMTGGHTLTAGDCPGDLCPARPSWFTGSVRGTTSTSEDVHKLLMSNFCFKILHKAGLPFQELPMGHELTSWSNPPTLLTAPQPYGRHPCYISGPGSGDTQRYKDFKIWAISL